MKTAISIPDDMFAEAERLARALKKSRSQLYSDALREYVARHAADQSQRRSIACVERPRPMTPSRRRPRGERFGVRRGNRLGIDVVLGR